MNRYRRYPQIHAATTAHLSLAEEGAYSRLLDWQYCNESPLPSTPEGRYRITRAITAAERRATEKIAAAFFNAAGWQPRAHEDMDSKGSSEPAPPEPAPREPTLPPVIATVAGPAVATSSPPEPPPDDRTASPDIIPTATLDLGEKLLAAPGMRVRDIHEILEDVFRVVGRERGLELLRQCQREAPRSPGAWLAKAVDAHQAAAALA